jgi:hypothetical protein
VTAHEAPPRADRAATSDPALDGEPSPWLLIYALWGGLTSWALHLWTLTSLASDACRDGLTWAMHLTTGVTGVGAIAAIVAAVHLNRRVSRIAAANGRTRMLSALAVLIDVASLALIVLEAIPAGIIDPCRVT